MQTGIIRIHTLVLLIFLVTFLLVTLSNAQTSIDTPQSNLLEEVQVIGILPIPERLNAVEDNTIFSGKKNEVIRLSSLNANLVTNNSRQLFSRIPGITIWENDGSGIQISIGARGLNPNRSWEFNTRQNGYDISSDVFGYPEAYYNPPMEAVSKIQLIRGAASLQFGPQFGGMVNYVIKRQVINKPFSFETQNAVGSDGMFSSYNAIGGNTKKWNYYVYNHTRKGNGWRENGYYEIRHSHAYLQYKFDERMKVSIEYTNMDYKNQQSGGLTDVQFEEDAQQSLRQRNWFGTPWNLANIVFEYAPVKNLSFNLKFFGLLGERNSVGFTARPNVKDTINRILNDYNERQIDIDEYQNLGMEFRSIYSYELYGGNSNLAFGARAYQAETKRKQRGTGNSEFDFDLKISSEKFPAEYLFQTKNIALFLENTFNVSKNISITPGIRFENIGSSIHGRANIINGSDVNVTPQTIERNVVLTGIGLEYKINEKNLYANLSQAYRPVLFSDLIPPATTDIIDPNLKDANGFNAELGYRGILGKYLNFDLSGFYIQYNNRIGTIRKFIDNDPLKATYQFRTNLGKSTHSGVEAYVELEALKSIVKTSRFGSLHIFVSLSFINAEYVDFRTTQISGTAPNIIITAGNLKGKKVEYAPNQIHNIGITYSIGGFSTTFQNRMSSEVYSDATNTEKPVADVTIGKIDGYSVFDLSAEITFLQKYNLKAGINNLTDTRYTTRRASGYPGPGLIPGDGRTFYISVGAKF